MILWLKFLSGGAEDYKMGEMSSIAVCSARGVTRLQTSRHTVFL